MDEATITDPQRPRRAAEGALLGGLAGLLLSGLLAQGTKIANAAAGAGVGGLAGLAVGALTPVPLSEAVEEAAKERRLLFVSLRRTGILSAVATVKASDGFHILEGLSSAEGSREVIDDDLYAILVRQMEKLPCLT